MSKYHNTYQRIYQEKYRFLDTVTQLLLRDLNEYGLFPLMSAQIVVNFPAGTTGRMPAISWKNSALLLAASG